MRIQDSRPDPILGTGVWQSADPMIEDYLPTGNPKADAKLPGVGGVFNTVNLNVYAYAGLSPVKITDEDGRSQKLVITNQQVGTTGVWTGKNHTGDVVQVPVYLAVLIHYDNNGNETGRTQYLVTRDYTHGGFKKVDPMNVSYASGNEAPPGTYHVVFMVDKNGNPINKIMLYTDDSQTAKIGGGPHIPYLSVQVDPVTGKVNVRISLEIHGVGTSDGCPMTNDITRLINTMKDNQAYDKANNVDPTITVVIQPRHQRPAPSPWWDDVDD